MGNDDTRKKVNTISWFVAILAVNNILVFTPSFGAPYYIMMALALFYCLSLSRIRSIDVGMLCLYICCLISIVGNTIPSFFKPWGRLASFVLMTMLISPFIKSDLLFDFRIRAFSIVQKLLEYVVIASVLAYFGGFAYSMGYFAGVTAHSQLMGPIAACTMISGIYTLTDSELQRKRFEKYYKIILIFCSLICLLLAASRTAIVAVIIAVLTYIYLANREHFSRIIKYLCVAIIALIIAFPVWSPYMDVVLKKNESSMAAGGIASSRDDHWENRLNEFRSSPIIGIGFSVVSTESTEGSTFDLQTGGVETGSSWLSSLSMMGILGFSALVFLFVTAFRKFILVGRVIPKYSAYLFSLLVFWGFHMMAEGYIWGAGGFLFFNVWLLLGCADALYHKYVSK